MKKTTIGGRIRWVIESHLRISQADFARKIRKSRQLVNRWVNDPKNPPEEKNLEEIARMSGVSLVWLRYGEGDPFAKAGTTRLDPVVLHTALQEVLAIINKALGAESSAQANSRIEDDMMDASPDLMTVLSHDEKVLRAGRQWTHAMGWEREDLEGKQWEDIAHPSDIQTSRLAFTISREQDAIVEFDGRVRDKEGEHHNIRWRVTNDENKIQVVGRETSEPKRTGLQVITRDEKEV